MFSECLTKLDVLDGGIICPEESGRQWLSFTEFT